MRRATSSATTRRERLTRTNRRRTRAVLRNDYVRLNDELQKRIAERMAEARTRRGMERLDVREVTSKTPTPEPKVEPRAEDEDAGRAFCVIDQIADGSPGDVDGLRVGDRVCAVGGVRWGFEDARATPPASVLTDASRAFSENENVPVRVVVLRRGERVVVSVTPRAWSGRGLVGIHMQLL